MSRIVLTPRQEAVVSLLAPQACIADIGCDHGKLGAYLLQSGLAQRVIATDISALSLQKAEQLAQELGLLAGFSFRVGDGLTVLAPGEAQAAVISGMGAYTIMEILRGAPDAAQAYILQPMGHESALRAWLIQNGFSISDDRVAAEGKRFYHILRAERGRQEAREEAVYLPWHSLLRGDEAAKRFACTRARELKNILSFKADEAKVAEYRLLAPFITEQ